jgi:Flp pilus assembly protein TadG
MNFFKNNRGAAAVEFALVALPVMGFIIGIILFAWAVWVDNLLHISVDTASRCGAIGSTTSPCDGAGPVNGGSTANLISTAITMFRPLTPDATTFKDNTDCSVDVGTGLQGTGLKGSYQISIGLGVFSMNLIITADSCYPTVPQVPA